MGTILHLQPHLGKCVHIDSCLSSFWPCKSQCLSRHMGDFFGVRGKVYAVTGLGTRRRMQG